MSPVRSCRPTFLRSAVFLGAIVACGAWLRCWHIGGQLLLDDEWHALNFVQGKDLFSVLVGQGLGANSIPVNIWTWILMNTSGWSEILLRLPSLVVGIASIAVIPLLVRRLLPGFAWQLVAAAMAISPVLTFYSRVARPYAPAALLGGASVLLAGIWLRERKQRHLYLAAAAGALAVWWHLYSLVPVGTALAVAALLACLGDARAEKVPFLRVAVRLWRPALLFAVPVLVLVGIPNAIDPWWLSAFKAGERASLETLWGVVEIVFGTSSTVLRLLCLAFFFRGWVAIRASDRDLFAL
ncbi:MAG TPA: hypothetical protein VIU29_07385, partial [Candidatus Deferrimicrobiaceae bacterium]